VTSDDLDVRMIAAGWADEIRAGVRADGSRLRIVSPFIKELAVQRLLGRNRPITIEVITRFSLPDFAVGVSDASALRRILPAGGRVRGVRGLHAKLYMCGSERAILTSANLTVAAMHQNREFGCVSTQKRFIEAANRYFADLWALAKPDLTFAQLDEWEAVLEPIIARGGRPSEASALPNHGAETAVPDTVPPSESTLAASPGKGYVKFFGEGDNRVRWDFDVLEEVRRSGCHWACTYPAGRRPRSVEDGDTMYMGRLVSGPNESACLRARERTCIRTGPGRCHRG
jgi:hypothetical protein